MAQICEPGGKGTFVYGEPWLPDDWHPAINATIYLLLLSWAFVGVAILADLFMSSIEEITSLQKTIMLKMDDKERIYRVAVWNATISNLTLMALGSSAPEILLAAIELMSSGFHAGELGPGTIVGSAAFNLLIIIAVCIVAIPATDSRKISRMGVYACTATCSMLAYLWLILILMGTSPDVVTLAEALATLLFFPLFVFIAYLFDVLPNRIARRHKRKRARVPAFIVDVKHPDGSPLTEDELAALVLKLRATHYKELTDEEAAAAIVAEMSSAQPRSLADYRRSIFSTSNSSFGSSAAGETLPARLRMRFASRAQPLTAIRESSGIGMVSAADAPLDTSASPAGEGTAPAFSAPVKSRPSAIVEREGKFSAAELCSLDRIRIDARAPTPTIEFEATYYSVLEGVGQVCLTVIRHGSPSSSASVEYRTMDGTATAGTDYMLTEGVLTFGPGEQKATLCVQILKDKILDGEESFMVTLSNPAAIADATDTPPSPPVLGLASVARVAIIDDEAPGTFVLRDELVRVFEADGKVQLTVERVGGCKGEVSLRWSTADGTALAGDDYVAAQGELRWDSKDVAPKTVEIEIVESIGYEPKEFFEVIFSEATGGATFDASTDGDKERSIARVIILEDDQARTIRDRAIDLFGLDRDRAKLRIITWKEQIVDALSFKGGDSACAHASSAAAFALLAPWRVLAAAIPPPQMGSGWPCFLACIAAIGVVTAVIGDLANLFSCEVSLRPAVAAITIVALGTSLPDTFASKSAANADATADNAVGNVTGSNAVNVFLGLGISWTVGAAYWSSTPATASWLARYPTVAARYQLSPGDALPGLAVPAGDLGFSVTLFVLCAAVCFALMQYRRVYCGGELGGRLRWLSFSILVVLWVTYVIVSALRSYQIIEGF